MKRFAKIAAMLMAIVMIASVGEGTVVSAATKPTISKTSRNIYVGGSTVSKNSYAKGTYTLSVKNRPEKYTIEWSSSDESIATVAPYKGTSKYKGTVTAVAPGKATITATVIDKTVMPYNKVTLSCKVTVKKNCAAVDISPATVSEMKVGDKISLTGTMYDKAARALTKGKTTTDVIRWMSSNDSVATVSSTGEVKAVGEGKATITCYTIQTASGTYAKYKYATAKDSVDITVKNPGVTAMVDVKQLSLNTLKLTFASDFSKIVTKDNIKVTRNNINADISKVVFNENGTEATVTMTSTLATALEYKVELLAVQADKGKELTFKTSNGKPVSMEMTTDIPGNMVIAGSTSTIRYKFYDANGIDVTPDAKSTDYALLTSRITVQEADHASLSSVFGTSVWIANPGVSVVAIATYNDYAGTTFSTMAAITSVSESSTITEVETMITKSGSQSSTLDWSVPKNSLSKSDTEGYRIVARAKKTDGKYIYSDESGSKLSIAYPDGYSSRATFLSGNGALYPFKEGADDYVVKFDNDVVGAGTVIVGSERIPVKMVTLIDGVEASTVEFSDATGVTNPEVRIAVYDNYGDRLPITTLFNVSVTNLDNTAGAIFPTASNTNSDGTATVNFYIPSSGTESGRSQTIQLTYDDGKNKIVSGLTAVVYKPVYTLPTTYQLTVQGDTDAVVNSAFDTAHGKKLTVTLLAYKGKVRYQDITLLSTSAAIQGSYYAIVKRGDTTVQTNIAGNGSIEIPVATISGGTITKALPGEYTITIYCKAATGYSDAVVAMTHVTIKDSQEGASWSKTANASTYVLSENSTKSEKIAAFNQCFNVKVNGVTATVTDIDALTVSGGMYVRTVTVTGVVNIGGASYNVSYPVAINTSIQAAR